MTIDEMKSCCVHCDDNVIKFHPKSVSRLKDENGKFVKCFYMDVFREKVANVMGHGNFNADWLCTQKCFFVLRFRCSVCDKVFCFRAAKKSFEAARTNPLGPVSPIFWTLYRPKEGTSNFKGCECVMFGDISESRAETEDFADRDATVTETENSGIYYFDSEDVSELTLPNTPDQAIDINSPQLKQQQQTQACFELTPKRVKEHQASRRIAFTPTPKRLMTPHRLVVTPQRFATPKHSEKVSPNLTTPAGGQQTTMDSPKVSQESPLMQKFVSSVKALPREIYVQTMKMCTQYARNLNEHKTPEERDSAKLDLSRMISVQSYRDNSLTPFQDTQNILKQMKCEGAGNKRKKDTQGQNKKTKRTHEEESDSSTKSIDF